MTSKSLTSGMLVVVICASVALSSFAQEVYSPNVVGFQKISIPPSTNKYTLNSSPFSATQLNINYVIGNQLTGGNSYDTADDIMMWDPTALGGKGKYKLYWLAGNVGETNYNYKWIDSDTGEVATNTDIPNGVGFWVRSRRSSNQTVVVAGEVELGNSVTTRVVNGLQLLAYPYAASIPINNTRFTNGGVGGLSYDVSDDIMIWSTTIQRYKQLWLAGNVGDTNYNNRWIDSDTGEVASNTVLNTGVGFWYRHRGAGFNWIEPKPYTL